VTLIGGSNLALSVTESELDWITGKLGLEVGHGGDPFMAVDLEGTYTAGKASFTGGGQLKFIAEYDPGFTLGGYRFVIQPGETFISAHVTNNEIDWVDGGFSVHMLKEGGTILVALGGKYEKGVGFTGTGTCEILDAIVIGNAGKFGFKIDPGAGLSIELKQGNLEFIEGDLHGEVLWDGPFLEIDAKVTYRNQGTAKVDVKGSAKILAAKCLVEGLGDNSYEFWLDKTEGPTAEVLVEKNEVKKVSGEIGLKICTEGEDFVIGHANGTWTNADNMFTGGGSLHTGRDLSFNLGTRIDILQGSGGEAKVAKSELRELKGEIHVDIYDSAGEDAGKLFHADAEGHYDAVANNLIRAKGSVTLMKPWIAMGATPS
jgi:hypothetical protein